MNFDQLFDDVLTSAVEYVADNGEPVLDAIAFVVELFTGSFLAALTALPAWAFIIVVTVLALWRKGVGFAVFTLASLLLILGTGLWAETIDTLALVLSATCLSVMAGLPLGIWAARSARVEGLLKVMLDFMQTMPAFVYLIPAVIFFGLGAVPGTIATVVFSMPPSVRLTALGIKQVPVEMIEAGKAFGCTDRQLLVLVQLPNALPSIMAGINQTLMMALSMVVIASMIGAGGLGNVVLTGIQRLDVGLGLKGGLGVVLLAIILDRITQSVGDLGAARRAGALRALFQRMRPLTSRPS